MTIQSVVENGSMVHLEPAEVLSLLRAAKAKRAREWAMLLLAVAFGARPAT